MSGRLFSIADIHGRIDLVTQLVKTLVLDHALDLTRDKLIFTGDYIDRGPDSKGVLDFLMNLQSVKGPDRVVCLAGNHEWLMLDAMVGAKEFELWMKNGGGETIASFGWIDRPPDRRSIPISAEYLNWCLLLPLYHEEPGFFFSHAPIPVEAIKNTSDSVLPYDAKALLWTYQKGPEDVWTKIHDGMVGVCGHIHRLRERKLEPRFYPHYIFGDTGAGCADYAPLAAIEVRSRKVIYAWPREAQMTQHL